MNVQDRFNYYQFGIDYQLSTLAEWQALPDQHKPLYTVAMEALLKEFKVGQSVEPFVPLGPFSEKHQLHIKNASGSTPTGGISGEIWLRQAAAEKLIQVTHALQQVNAHLALWITDGYRPLILQRQHFQLIMEQLKGQGYTGEDLYQRTTQLIADPAVFPPHSLGGTLDLTLYDQRTDQTIDMGTVVDAIEVPWIHSWCKQITDEQKSNRLLLYTAMTAAGFTNTPLEWWHYSYGDLEWALHTGTNATLYAPVERLDAGIVIE